VTTAVSEFSDPLNPSGVRTAEPHGGPVSVPAPSPVWIPHDGPQRRFVESEAFEVVYGGARGGGKTDGALGDFFFHALRYGAAAKGLYVRRERVALEPTIARAKALFAPAGARWIASRSQFEWENGATLRMRPLKREADADAYQGHDYSRLYVEELTQFPTPVAVDKLMATLRSAAGAHCGMRATCNPGGVGHAWVKARYVDPGPNQVVVESFKNPFTGEVRTLSRLFVPALLADNPALNVTDPNYVARLHKSGSRERVRAWLEGDWSIVEGAFFDGWSIANIVAPFSIPEEWSRLRSFDWGYARPFSVGWWVQTRDAVALNDGTGRVIPRGALVRYREWYGSPGGDDTGLRLTAEEVADGIRKREAGETIDRAFADPPIFAENGGPSLAERLSNRGVRFRPADNTRVGRLGAFTGWDQMRARIRGDGGVPMLYVFSTCTDFIRTIPLLQHDPLRPEDLDTRGEDHIADEARYACLARRLPDPAPLAQVRRDQYRDPLRAVGWKGI
jgi:Terminase large subunit, T4likevirus-type, N-terminal